MESLAAIFMVVSVMGLSVYLAKYLRDSESKNQKLNDVFTFALPCIATMVIGLAVISDFLLLPIVITAAPSLWNSESSCLLDFRTERTSGKRKQKRFELYCLHHYEKQFNVT